METVFRFVAGLTAAFLVWTLCIYWLHRLGHFARSWNPLYHIHSAHHNIEYRETVRFHPSQLLFWQGSWKCTADVLITMTLPLVCITVAFPEYGVVLLVVHYVYETFFSESVLDHNPKLCGVYTLVFAWGTYHLEHHARPYRHFGLMITLWDYVFGTAGTAKTRFSTTVPDHKAVS